MLLHGITTFISLYCIALHRMIQQHYLHNMKWWPSSGSKRVFFAIGFSAFDYRKKN